MRIGFVVNQIITEEIGYDTTLLTYTAANKGHEVYIMGLGDLCYLEEGLMGAHAVKVPKLKTRNLENLLKQIQDPKGEKKFITSKDLDVLFLRNNPSEEFGERAWAKTAGMIFGQIAMSNGVLVLNDPYALMSSFNKMYFQHFPEEVRPRTIITRDVEEIRTFFEKEKGKIILKPLQGSGGKDVFLLDNATNLNQIVESINRSDFLIAQEYLPEAKNGDTRVIMINGKILEVKGKPAIMQRVNKSDDIRSNIHAGGKSTKAKLTPSIQRLCQIVGPKLVQDGMFIAGIDIVGDKIMELNLDSPGGVVSMEDFEKEKFAEAIIQKVEKKIEYKFHYQGTLPNSFLATLDL